MTTKPQNGLNFHFSLLQSKLLLWPLSPLITRMLDQYFEQFEAHTQNYHDVK